MELLSGSGVIRHVRGTGSPRLDALAQGNDGVGMSRSQLVAEHLPLLRRYARALTGNQASGDAYVGAMLEALLQDGSLLDEQHGSRAGLFCCCRWKVSPKRRWPSSSGPTSLKPAGSPTRRDGKWRRRSPPTC